MLNPLLNFDGLPPFDQIKPKHVKPAITQLLEGNREKLKALLSGSERYTWQNLLEPLEDMEERLKRVWSPVSHMNSVVNSDELRDAYNACLPLLSQYSTEMGQNETLFQAIVSIATGDEYLRLDVAQKKVVDNAVRDFKLSGVGLPEDKKKRYKEVSEKLSQLGAKFSENVLDATGAWKKLFTTKERLAGLTDSALAIAQQAADKEGKEGWLFTLDFPSYYAVITFADDRELRREIYEAFVTRASDQGPNKGEWDNAPLIEEILALRHEAAQILGFNNYAESSLATKMASTPEEVISFLEGLAEKSKTIAENDLAALKEFAAASGVGKTMEAWDVAYYAEKLRLQNYALSQEALRPYFPVNQVLQGMFTVVKRLYGINIKEVEGVNMWHEDARFYEITDAGGEVVGQFYIDLFARAHKRGGAWMDECITRRKVSAGVDIPVAYLTCNFTPPVGDKPALLTHDEVVTLFHEFGHGLHHMMTQIDYPSVSGINGVAWDAVELPSQFMENWCWEKEALSFVATHHETGEPLPDALFDKMQAARNFQSGMQMVRQIEFSLFDFRIHLDYDPEKGGRVTEILAEVRDQVAVLKPPAFNRFPNSFSHIFAGGYAAGYYSYKWAEVLSSDAYSLFEETGIFNEETGRKFLDNILTQGGSREPMELFVAFRGREPKIDALLRHNGIAA